MPLLVRHPYGQGRAPAAAAEVSPEKDTGKNDDAKETAKPSADSKPDDARIPDYKPSAALLSSGRFATYSSRSSDATVYFWSCNITAETRYLSSKLSVLFS